ncbi:MAG: hypothetical protein KDM64_02450, partial [Verrucomicrobiae bacterium]|nr:hypothetical protein [Verrucomicrobiae bacterium]
MIASLCTGMVVEKLAAAEKEPETPNPGELTKEAYLPGVGLARGITQLTGVAISPMLGVSTVGAWHYFRTPESLRKDLP